MLCEGTPVAANGQHSQVGLLRNIILPVHKLFTSFVTANVIPSLVCREESDVIHRGSHKLGKTIGTSRRRPWEVLKLLIDLFRAADLSPEPADSPEVIYPWFCPQATPTLSRLYSCHRKSRHVRQWNMTPAPTTSQLPLFQKNKGQDHQTTNPAVILQVPASASLLYPECQLPSNSHRTYLQDENPKAGEPDLCTSYPGGTLTYQSGKIPPLPSSPQARVQAQRQERTWSKGSDVVYRTVSNSGLRKASGEGFYIGNWMEGFWHNSSSICWETQLDRWTHGDSLCDLPKIHDFCLKRNNSLPSHANDMSNAPWIFFLITHNNTLCPEYFMNMNLTIMQFNSVFTGQHQISEIETYSHQGKG